MSETWKDIEGYEGLYQVSDLGRIKSVERTVIQFNHQLQKRIAVVYPKRYLKLEKMKDGYMRVTLSKGNKQVRSNVHRLVAKAFISNSDNKPHVHHKNSVRHDNRACNLEWVTAIENEHYKWKEKQPSFEAISPNGERTVWDIQIEAARQLGLNRNGIRRCLFGEVESYRGYTFKFITPTK